MHFAFDNGTHYDAVGPVDVGETGIVEDTYRLLAVLRLVLGWWRVPGMGLTLCLGHDIVYDVFVLEENSSKR